jgi:aryl-alcohol dehydrogenase-like predicted oxidoreductase
VFDVEQTDGEQLPAPCEASGDPGAKTGLLKTANLDLLQLHNVRDPQQSLAQFKAWQAHGLCRYIGITSTFRGDFAAVEAGLGRERPDFVHIGYSLDDRDAAKPVLRWRRSRLAYDRAPFGIAFSARCAAGDPRLGDLAGSCAQFLRKYLLGDERGTAVIPGTSDPAHMADNLGAMRGALPDQEQRKRMAAFIDGL